MVRKAYEANLKKQMLTSLRGVALCKNVNICLKISDLFYDEAAFFHCFMKSSVGNA